MKVKQLIEKLKEVNQEADIIIDGDTNGWYDLEKVDIYNDEDSDKAMVNLISSNEM
jgi:hypothetical protein